MEGGPWRLLGVIPLADPPREDSAATIAAARDLGVQVQMVTGDQVAIGADIARQVGLGDHILPASDLASADGETDDQLTRRVERADGYAEVFPEHKFRIVQLLQQRGHIVGMTGDGVNDAPALKQADAGIAVAGATDAARAATDVVLLAPDLSVIVEAIELAREIFARMTSYATYRIAETIRVLLLVVLAVVVVNFFPVTATMIVLLAILNDAAILTIAYDPRARVRQAGLMGHAHRTHRRHGDRHHGRHGDLPTVRPRRKSLWAQPRCDTHLDLPEAVGVGPPNHLRHPYPQRVLDPAGTFQAAPRSGHRDPGSGDGDRRFRHICDAAPVALGGGRVGLCAGMVPCRRQSEARHRHVARTASEPVAFCFRRTQPT